PGGAAGSGQGQRGGFLRPLHRRPHLPAAPEAGRRRKEPPVAQDGPWRGLSPGDPGERMTPVLRKVRRWNRPLRGSMFRRIFLYGMLILVVAAAAVLSVSAVFSSEGTRRGSLAPMARYLAEALEPLLDAPEALTKELAHAAAGTPFQLTIYRLDGTLLGSTVDPPLRPLKTREFALLERESGQLAGRFAPVVSRMEQDGQVVGYLLLKLRPLQPPWGRILTTVGLILVAMLLISIPIAGSITAPI